MPETVFKEQQCPTDAIDKRRPKSERPTSNKPVRTCLESDPGSCPNIAITDRLGLTQDQRRVRRSVGSLSP